ncbi:MAG: S8 family serine peptidase [Acidimicrobiales bacterium]
MPNQRSEPPSLGASWLQPLATLKSHTLLATATVLAMTAGMFAFDAELTRDPIEPAAADSLSLSMVELLGDEVTTTPMMLADLVGKVTGNLQRANGGDGTGVDVALIDSGVAPVDGLDGPNVVHGPDLSTEGGFSEVAYLDTYGHGTHMAGIIAGNRVDHEGVAPGARIVSVKVAGEDGVTNVAQVIAGIDWVIEHRNTDGLNVRVLNLSLGQGGVTTHEGDVLSAAVERAWNAGIFVVVAAGNEGDTRPQLDSPAIDPYVMAVGAVDGVIETRTKRQAPAAWSGFGDGDRNPELAAPGVSIASYRVPGSTVDLLAPTARYGDDLFLGSGTSQAAAVVSGLAARIFEDDPALTPDEMKATLLASAITRLSGAEDQIGAGVVRGGVAWTSQQYGATAQNHPAAAGPGTGIVAPTGNSWSGGEWSGNSWSGNSWSGNSWSGNSWSGATWSGNSWSGATWSGNSWSGNSWSGNSWSGEGWG